MYRLVVYVTLMCSWLCARAQEVKPYLRVEPGTHTARATSIDVDASQRFLVSASYDKTARVWDLHTGKLLKVLRPPIGDSYEGTLFAVAISPDGRSVAVGGFTGASGSNNFPIYIFDRESGAIRKSIPGLVEVTNDLAYSRTGRYLAAALGSHGVRIYETGDYSETARDTDYGDSSHSVEFDTSERLVTTSYDGYVRLYNSDFRLQRKEHPPGGKNPYSASFSPDGNLIAIGFDDTSRVDVLSGKNLKFQYNMLPKHEGNAITSVAWSADGRTLCAAGSYSDSGRYPILCAADGGKGVLMSSPIAVNTVMALRMLADGAIAFAVSDGPVGVVDSKGITRWRVDPDKLDFRADSSLTGVSSDGNTLESCVLYFNGDRWSQRTIRFSVQQGKLEVDPKLDGSLAKPMTTGLSVEGWRNTDSPRLNGKILPLKQYEASRSRDCAEHDTFVLGADWTIYKFDRDGKQLWSTPVQGAAWSVNISADGRFVVAALGDGTMRWYTFDKGKEAFGLFVDHDLRRWVAWTPSGYYDLAGR